MIEWEAKYIALRSAYKHMAMEYAKIKKRLKKEEQRAASYKEKYEKKN